MNRLKLPERFLLRCFLFRRHSSDRKHFTRCFSENAFRVVKKSSRATLTRELQRVHYHLNRYFDIKKKSSAIRNDADNEQLDAETTKNPTGDPKSHYTINIYYNTPPNKSPDSSAIISSLFSKPDTNEQEKKLRASIEQYLLHRMMQDKNFLESSLKKFLKNDLKNASPEKMNLIKEYINNRHDDYLISALTKLHAVQEKIALPSEKEVIREEVTEDTQTITQEQIGDSNTTVAKTIQYKEEIRNNNVLPPSWIQMHQSVQQVAEENAKDEPAASETSTNTIQRPAWANFSDVDEPHNVSTQSKEPYEQQSNTWSDYDPDKISQGEHTQSYREEEFGDDSISVENPEPDVVQPKKVMTDEEMAALFYAGIPEGERKEMIGYPGGKYNLKAQKRRDILNNSSTVPQFDDQKRGLSDDEMAAIYHAYSAGQQLYYPGGISINRRRKLQLDEDATSETQLFVPPDTDVKPEEPTSKEFQEMLDQESHATERVLSEQYNKKSEYKSDHENLEEITTKEEYQESPPAIEQKYVNSNPRKTHELRFSIANPDELVDRPTSQKHAQCNPLNVNSEILDYDIDDDIYMTSEGFTTPRYVHFRPSHTKTEPATISINSKSEHVDDDKTLLQNIEMKDNHVVISTPTGKRRRIPNGFYNEEEYQQYLKSLADKSSPRRFSNETAGKPRNKQKKPSDNQQKVDEEISDTANPEKSYIETLRELSQKAFARMNEALFPNRVEYSEEEASDKRSGQLFLPPPDLFTKANTMTTIGKIAEDMAKIDVGKETSRTAESGTFPKSSS